MSIGDIGIIAHPNPYFNSHRWRYSRRNRSSGGIIVHTDRSPGCPSTALTGLGAHNFNNSYC
jgi:hypothetical protein